MTPPRRIKPRKSKPEFPYPIYLEWVDSEAASGWDVLANSDYDRTGLIIKSIGYICGESGNEIFISTSWDEDNKKYIDILAIPKVAIIKRKKIKI